MNDKKQEPKCKHGTNPEWCAFCTGLVTKENQHQGQGPGYMYTEEWEKWGDKGICEIN